MSNSDDNPDPRYFGLHMGYVVDNRDPLGLRRIRLCVRGLTPDEGSDWSMPIGVGGIPNRGHWDAPEVNAEVGVFFLGGDPSRCRYIPGGHAIGNEPTAVKSAKDAAGSGDGEIDASIEVKVLHETPDWQVVADEREGNRRLYINSKVAGENLANGSALMIELDRESGVLALVGTGGVAINSLGAIKLQATTIEIGGRRVMQGTDKPI